MIDVNEELKNLLVGISGMIRRCIDEYKVDKYNNVGENDE